MKFIKILSLIFALIYFAIAIHYLSFDRKKNLLQDYAKMVKDTKISTSFKSKKYESFVYE